MSKKRVSVRKHKVNRTWKMKKSRKKLGKRQFEKYVEFKSSLKQAGKSVGTTIGLAIGAGIPDGFMKTVGQNMEIIKNMNPQEVIDHNLEKGLVGGHTTIGKIDYDKKMI